MNQQYTPEQAKAYLWLYGDLSWKLRPEQKELKKNLEQQTVQLGVFNISRRWGKTFTLVIYALEQALQTKQRIRFACAYLTDLEEFVLPAFEQILEDCPEHLRPTYIRSRKVWMFANGSEIKLVGLDKNPNGLRGNALSILIIDEAGFVSDLKYLYTSVVVPATAKQKNIKILFISTPPESPEHYFVDLINKAQLQKNGYYLELTIDDISDLDPKERTRLLDEVGGEFSTTAQREFFCKIIIDATRSICPEFNEKLHVKSIELPSHFKTWQTTDVGGVRDKTVSHLFAYDFERAKVLVLKEFAANPQTSTEDLITGLKDLSLGHNLTRNLADGSGQTRVDFNREGFHCSLPDKEDFDAGLNMLRLAFQRGLIEIDPSCKLLIATLTKGMLNKQRTDYTRTESLGHCDAVANLVYGYRHRVTQNPFPDNYGLHSSTHYIPPKSSSTNDRNLARAFGRLR